MRFILATSAYYYGPPMQLQSQSVSQTSCSSFLSSAEPYSCFPPFFSPLSYESYQLCSTQERTTWQDSASSGEKSPHPSHRSPWLRTVAYLQPVAVDNRGHSLVCVRTVQ